MKNIPGKATNYLVALIALGFGTIYLFRSSFMPYHSEAVSLSWDMVDGKFRILILAIMRAASGGYLVGAVVIAVLQYRFDKTGLKWIPPLILISGSIVALTSLYATLIVRLNSPGRPPTLMAIVLLVMIIAGFFCNRGAKTEVRPF
ncbi:MAG TPA: hypothetical protein PLX49_05715 [Prolixibacteraceae bacterium]|nr:hypothetical protein [Prolixibacteraceae bacterium]